MKKILVAMSVATLIIVVAPATYAGGYGGGSDDGGKIIFSGDHAASGHTAEAKTSLDTTNVTPLTAAGFVFTMKTIAVFVGDPGLEGAELVNTPHGDRWVVRYDDQPDLFEGATLYAFGTQSDWPAPRFAREAEFNTDNVYGATTVDGPRVSIEIENRMPGASRVCQPVVWFLVFKDGSWAWGGHPDYPAGKWVVWNMDGRPQTAFLLDNQQGMVYPDKACQEMAANRR